MTTTKTVLSILAIAILIIIGCITRASAQTFEVRIGNYGPKNSSALSQNLQASGVEMSTSATSILYSSVTNKEQNLKIELTTGRELGLSKGSNYKDLIKAAEKNGYTYAPAEAIFQLLLQIEDSTTTKNFDFTVFMKPVQYSYNLWGSYTYTKGVLCVTGTNHLTPSNSKNKIWSCSLEEYKLVNLDEKYAFAKK